MQKVEFNYIKKIFPFIINSKFLLKKFSEQPYIKNIEISLQLNNKQKPEILFWILFSLNNKKNFLNYVHKKKYINGKSIIIKSFLKISKKLGAKKNTIYRLLNLFQKTVTLAKEICLVKSLPLKRETTEKCFKFYEIKFEDKYLGLINLSPINWQLYNIKFTIKPKFYSGFHFRFFLQNLQLPVL